MRILKNIGVFILCIVVGMCAVVICDVWAQSIAPPPSNFDYRDPQQLQAYVRGFPLSAQLVMILGWCLSPLSASLLAKYLARPNHLGQAIAIGIFTTVGTVANLLMIKYHPLWMNVAGVLLPFLMAMLPAFFNAKAKGGEPVNSR